MRTTTPKLVLAFLVLGCACGDDGNTAAEVDAGVDIDAADVVPRQPGFNPVYEEWKVPDTETAGGAFVANISSSWRLVDFDGDGALEFIRTRNPATNRAWDDQEGQQNWRVYVATTGGFASTTFDTLILPASGDSQGFLALARSQFWQATDIDGDGGLDLIQFRDPAASAVWETDGQKSWRVFLSSGFTFGQAQEWSIPTLGAASLLFLTRLSAEGYWATVDLSGDGVLDMVHTAESPLGVFDPMTPNWRMYRGTSTGFESTATSWAVPQNENDKGFLATAIGQRWSTMDIDLDGTLELVQSGGAPPEALGPFIGGASNYWRVFANTGSSFESVASEWSVPSSFSPFTQPNSDGGSLRWQTVDIDGDGLLDLVHTANAANATPTVWGSPNSDQWKVYLGTGSGFSPKSIVWPMPDSGTLEGFYALNASQGESQWVTVDLEGDGLLELVQTADPTTGAVWLDDNGDPYWRVFRRL